MLAPTRGGAALIDVCVILSHQLSNVAEAAKVAEVDFHCPLRSILPLTVGSFRRRLGRAQASVHCHLAGSAIHLCCGGKVGKVVP